MLWGNFKPERPGQPDIPARSPHECCNGTENTRLKDGQDPVMTRRIPSYDTHHDSDVDAVDAVQVLAAVSYYQSGASSDGTLRRPNSVTGVFCHMFAIFVMDTNSDSAFRRQT